MDDSNSKNETEKKQKPKLAFQLIKNINGYTAIWLVDGKKHTQSILTDDKSKANLEYKKLQDKIKKKYKDINC